MACGAQLVRTSVFLWMRNFVPGGARGVQFKSKTPKTCVYAEILGLRQYRRSNFKVSIACGINLSHSAKLNVGL